MQTSFTVYFRTGGTVNFKWHRVLDSFPDVNSAQDKCAELRKAGYPAYYAPTGRLDAIGLPETYTH